MVVGFYYPESPLGSKRDGRNNYNSINLSNTGFNRLFETVKRYKKIKINGTLGIHRSDVLLMSLVSFYDILNLYEIRKVYNKKIIVGGPAVNNIRGYLHLIDVACFGRCDGNCINDILSGKNKTNVWYKEKDPLFQNNYTVGIADPKSFVIKTPGLFGDNIEIVESSVGCSKKCSFCHYSHWNKFVCLSQADGYKSGFSGYEDFFTSIDWGKCDRGGVTAIDGGNEKTRLLVNKKITKDQLYEKILSVNKSNYEGLHRVKCYNIYGYPWETPEKYHLDLYDVVKKVDKKLKRNVLIKLQNSHFIPFVKTPMWAEPFNMKEFHLKIKEFKFIGKKICLFPGTHNQSPRISLLSTIIQRAFTKLPESFFSVKLWNKNYKKMLEYIDSEPYNFNLGKIKKDPIYNITAFTK